MKYYRMKDGKEISYTSEPYLESCKEECPTATFEEISEKEWNEGVGYEPKKSEEGFAVHHDRKTIKEIFDSL
jgi:hypothetical protein